MAIVTIIGAGMMGSAMAVPARDNGHTVRLVGTHLDGDIIEALKKTGEHPKMRRQLPEGIAFHPVAEMDAALREADVVICGVSSFGVEWFAREALPRIAQGVPVLSVTKGLHLREDASLLSFPDLLEAAQPEGAGHSFCAIGGPCTSYELASRHQTHVVFCGRDAETLRMLRGLLQTGYYHISLSSDVMGVETAVALKNAFALGVTMAIGLAERQEGTGCVGHYNTQAALFGQSVREMDGLLRLLGLGHENLSHGIGDLYVTIFGGRTRMLGTLLGRGLSFRSAMEKLEGITLESVVIAQRIGDALHAMAAQGRANLNDYPLLCHVREIIESRDTANLPWERFATESAGLEHAH